jgi:hypothetical protein
MMSVNEREILPQKGTSITYSFTRSDTKQIRILSIYLATNHVTTSKAKLLKVQSNRFLN